MVHLMQVLQQVYWEWVYNNNNNYIDGWIGLAIYIAVFLIVSFGLALKMNFKVKEYFRSSYEAYYGGIGTDLLLFLMIWVIFHNLVNIL